MTQKTYIAHLVLGEGRMITKIGKPHEHLLIKNESEIEELIAVLEEMKKVSMSIEEYLNQVTYDWAFDFEFTKGNTRFVFYSELTPSGQKEKPTVLYEENGNIYNQTGNIVVEGREIVPE